MDPCGFSRDAVLYRDFLYEFATGKNWSDVPETGRRKITQIVLCLLSIAVN